MPGNDILKKLTLAVRSGNCPQSSSLLVQTSLKQINKQFKVTVQGEQYKTSCMLEACKGKLPKHERIAWLIMERYEQVLNDANLENVGKNGHTNPAFVVDDKGHSPIYYACMTKKLEVIKKVFDRNDTDIHCVGVNFETPLHWCCRIRFVDGIKYLIERQANVAAKNQDSQLPIELLLANNDDSEDETALHYEDSISLGTCITERNLQEVIPLLLPLNDEETKIQLMSKFLHNEVTILHALAACDVKEGFISDLILEGASALAPDVSGYTPVSVACHQGKVEYLDELFLEYEEKKDIHGLRLSVIEGHIPVTEYLLQKAKYGEKEINWEEIQDETKSQQMKAFLKGLSLHSKKRNELIKNDLDILKEATSTLNVEVIEFVLLNSVTEIKDNIGTVRMLLDKQTQKDNPNNAKKSNDNVKDSEKEQDNDDDNESGKEQDNKDDKVKDSEQKQKINDGNEAASEKEQGNKEDKEFDSNEEKKDETGEIVEEFDENEEESSDEDDENEEERIKRAKAKKMIESIYNDLIEKAANEAEKKNSEKDMENYDDHENIDSIQGYSEMSLYLRGVMALIGEGEIPEPPALERYPTEAKKPGGSPTLEKSPTLASIIENDKVVLSTCLQQIQHEANCTLVEAIQSVIAEVKALLTDDMIVENPEYENNVKELTDKLEELESSIDINRNGIIDDSKTKISSLLQHHYNKIKTDESTDKFQEYVQYTILHAIAYDIDKKWKTILQKLFKNYPKWYIELMVKELRNNHEDCRNRVLDCLMRWKALNMEKPLPIYILTDALESPSLNMADVSHDIKQKMSMAADKESVAKEAVSEQRLSDLASKLSGDGKKVMAELGYEEDDEVWLESNPKEVVTNLLLEWKQNLEGSMVDNVKELADACSKAHRKDLEDLLTNDLEETDGIPNTLMRTLSLGLTESEWKPLGAELGFHQLELDNIEEDTKDKSALDNAALEMLSIWRQRTPGSALLKLALLIPALYKINRGDIAGDLGKCFKNEEDGTVSNEIFWDVAKGFCTQESKPMTMEEFASFGTNLGFDEEEIDDIVKKLCPDPEDVPTDTEGWSEMVFSLLLLYKEQKGKNSTKSHMLSSLLGAIDMTGRVSLAQKFKRAWLLQKMKTKESLSGN